MDPWFFMSYAHVDDEHRDKALVREFFEDLAKAVAERADNTPVDEAGFFDQLDINWGDPWPDTLARALRTCRTFVPIMTARYFRRDFCGREWAAFAHRSDAFRAAHHPDRSSSLPLILPILWVKPVEGDLPTIATDLQFTPSLDNIDDTERAKLAAFQEKGLKWVSKRKTTTHSNTYETIVEQLSTAIIEKALAFPLQPLPEQDLPTIRAVESPFQAPAAAAPAPVAGGGSSTANFVVVAARQDEVGAERRDYYRREPREWRPYDPREPVGLIAQAEAGNHRLFCDWLPVDDQLIDRLRQAEEDKSVAVMLIDPWTVRLDPYRAKLEHFDQFSFANCVVIVVWNRDDPMTQAEEDELWQSLQTALRRKFAQTQPAFFRDNISNQGELESAIRGALEDLEAIMAPRRIPVREVASGGLATPPSIGPNKGRDL